MEEEISQMSCELKLVCFNLPISAWEMRGQVKGSTMKKAAKQTKRFEALLKTVHTDTVAKNVSKYPLSSKMILVLNFFKTLWNISKNWKILVFLKNIFVHCIFNKENVVKGVKKVQKETLKSVFNYLKYFRWRSLSIFSIMMFFKSLLRKKRCVWEDAKIVNKWMTNCIFKTMWQLFLAPVWGQ